MLCVCVWSVCLCVKKKEEKQSGCPTTFVPDSAAASRLVHYSPSEAVTAVPPLSLHLGRPLCPLVSVCHTLSPHTSRGIVNSL